MRSDLVHYNAAVAAFESKQSSLLNPKFVYADGVTGAHVIEAKREQSARSAHRLVKAPKCPTRVQDDQDYEFNAAFYRARAAFDLQVAQNCASYKNEPVEHEHSRVKPRRDTVACKTVVEFREWQEAWRVRTEVEASSGGRPPVNDGVRETDKLSARAASKIADSCEYMALKKGGFKTFVTGTLDRAARDKLITCTIVAGDVDSDDNGVLFTPIVFSYQIGEGMQKEITRTMDALQKMYRRGWVRDDGKFVKGHDEGLPYLWVVEVPDNEHGAPNPHVHMLLGWRVSYSSFRDWAARIEKIWGNGAFHLEKIKDSTCAGAYMSKAAGYLCKAQGKKDQGFVKGNRYAISKAARAPAWERISHAQYHCMGQLIYDIYDHLTVKYGEKYRERKRLNDALLKIPKDKKALRLHVGKTLERVRGELKKIPIRCNKYQVVIKTKAAAVSFFSWLQNKDDDSVKREEWLPPKPDGLVWVNDSKPLAKDSLYFSTLYEKFRLQKIWRRLTPVAWICEAMSDCFYHQVKNFYDDELGILEEKKGGDCVLGDFYEGYIL